MNTISNLTVEGYKSIGEKIEVKFAVPNGEDVGSGLTFIVGKNNSGKTNIIDALKALVSNSKKKIILKSERHKKDTSGDTFISISVAHNNQQVDISIKVAANNFYWDKSSEFDRVWPDIKNVRFIDSNRKPQVLQGGSPENIQYTTESLIENENKYNARGSSQNQITWFHQSLIQVLADSAKRRKFTDFMKELIPNFESIDYDKSYNQPFFSYTTKDGVEVTFDAQGDGVNNVIKIATSLAHDDKCLLVIDEPENSLHIASQKKLLEILKKESTKRQIVIITHSPSMLDIPSIAKAGALINRVYADNGTRCATLRSKNANVLDSLYSCYSLPFAMGDDTKNMFFSDKLFFVEGHTDAGLIGKFYKDNSLKQSFDFFGYGATGASNILNLIRVAVDLQIKSGGLYDNDDAGKMEMSVAKKMLHDEINQGLVKLFLSDKEDIHTKISKEGVLMKEGYYDKNDMVYTITSENGTLLRSKLKEVDDYFNNTNE